MICTNVLSLCADSRFAKPRSSLKKVLILSVVSRHCDELIQGLQNLESPCKGFNCCGAKLPLRCADSRFAKPRKFPERERVVTFCIVQKVTKKHAGLRPATSIQIAGRYEIFAEMSGIHQVTGYAENCSFPGIAGNDLNRCDAPALQHKIRAKSKRTAAFFANSRLRAVGKGGGGQKRVILGGNKESLCKRKTFGLRKRAVFSAHAKPTKKEKLFINTAKSQFSTAPKLTCSCKFHLRKRPVSLQYNNPFS